LIDSEEGKFAVENDKMDVKSENEDEPDNKDDDGNKENTIVTVEGGESGYLRSRAQNIEIVKKLAAEFRADFELSLDTNSKQRKPASKKKGKKVQNEGLARRQSQRNKDRCVFTVQ
jgi:hypothetical protein